jgi:hypothetical protein
MHKVKPILKKECEKRNKKKYMKGANPMQKGTSVSGLLYMPLDKLENIEKISIQEDRSDEKDDKDVEKLNGVNGDGDREILKYCSDMYCSMYHNTVNSSLVMDILIKLTSQSRGYIGEKHMTESTAY